MFFFVKLQKFIFLNRRDQSINNYPTSASYSTHPQHSLLTTAKLFYTSHHTPSSAQSKEKQAATDDREEARDITCEQTPCWAAVRRQRAGSTNSYRFWSWRWEIQSRWSPTAGLPRPLCHDGPQSQQPCLSHTVHIILFNFSHSFTLVD